MPGDHVLDTNIVIAFFANEPAVVARLSSTARFFVPAIVFGELHFGARRSGRPAQNLARIAALLPQECVIPADAVTAEVYGEIKAELLAKGQPLPENDIWIAATAIQHNLTLVTRDAHFEGHRPACLRSMVAAPARRTLGAAWRRFGVCEGEAKPAKRGVALQRQSSSSFQPRD